MGTPIRAPLKATSKGKAETGFLVPGSQPAPQARQQAGPPEGSCCRSARGGAAGLGFLCASKLRSLRATADHTLKTGLFFPLSALDNHRAHSVEAAGWGQNLHLSDAEAATTHHHTLHVHERQSLERPAGPSPRNKAWQQPH